MNKFINKYNNLPVQVKASFWFLICSFLQKGISVITTPIFTRLLTTGEYGQYNVFNSWLGIISVFVTLNLYAGVYIQGLVKYEDRKYQYASSLQGLVCTLCIFWLVVYLLFHSFWNNLFSLTTVQMLAMLSMIWTSSIYGFWSTNERVEFRYRKLVIVSLLVSLAKPILGILLVIKATDKVTARILGLAIVELIAYSWMFIYQQIKGNKFFSLEFWEHALKFNIPLLPHYLSTVVLNSSDRIMIKDMVSADSAGIYSLAYSISQIMTLFNTALLQTIEPWLYKKIKAREIKDIGRVAYPTFSMIAILNLLLIAFAPEIIALFAPPAYYEAIWVIPPVTMSVYFMFSYTFFAVFEFSFEKTQYITIATTTGAIANIILNYIFILLCGYQAAAYTTLFCYVIYAVYHYHFMKKICHDYLDDEQPFDINVILKITIAFLVCGFVFLLSYNNAIIRYVFILILIIIGIINRKKMVEMVKDILNTRQKV